MNENAKTGMFVVLAAMGIAAAWFFRPVTPQVEQPDDTGQVFFASLDTSKATSLEIVRFNEETGETEPFKVAKIDGKWSIPSHENYPTDAEDQFTGVVTALAGLRKGRIVSDARKDHEKFGVKDPANATVGDTGVGTRVTLRSQGDDALADIIIGKADKDNLELRFARFAGAQDRVYTTNIDLAKLSTKFEDWIQTDLLNVEATEVKRILVNDYSIDEVNQRLIERGRMILEKNPGDSVWTLQDKSELERLKQAPIRKLTSSLQQLKIVDVRRKPEALSSSLAEGTPMSIDAQTLQSLQQAGFYVVQNQLRANEGETIIGLNNGVEIALMFGEILLTPATVSASGEEETTGGANRFLFLSAYANEDLVPQPKLQDPDALPDITALPDDGAGEDAEQLMAEMKQKIEDANAREQDMYETRLTSARESAKALNRRFADWYFVISDDVYQSIRLRRGDLVEPIEPVEDEDVDEES